MREKSLLRESKETHVFSKISLFSSKEYEIPKLKLLDDMVELVKNGEILPDLSNTIFIGVQHILETTVTLFDALIALGVKPENMYFSGKCYSTSPEIAHQVKKRKIKLMKSNKPEEPGEYEKYCRRGIAKMWDQCIDEISDRTIDRIIILDEGGRCLEAMPEFVCLDYAVCAIEQTRGGLYSESVNSLLFPLVEVASCAVKKILEPPLIAEAIIKRVKKTVESLNPDKNTIFGIVGNGAIGYGICRFLLSQGYKIICYDENEHTFQNIVDKNFYRVENTEKVIARSNIIFGCTGKDITEGLDILGIVKKAKIFISCTSEDKEFRSLLRKIKDNNVMVIDPLSDIKCYSKNGSEIMILQGGFPFNFDRKPWNVPANSIEVTQGLLLGSCVQAITFAAKPMSGGITVNRGSHQSLNPHVQRYVAKRWLARQAKGDYPENYLLLFDDPKWIQKNSGGKYIENNLVDACFANVNVEDNKKISKVSKSLIAKL